MDPFSKTDWYCVPFSESNNSLLKREMLAVCIIPHKFKNCAISLYTKFIKGINNTEWTYIESCIGRRNIFFTKLVELSVIVNFLTDSVILFGIVTNKVEQRFSKIHLNLKHNGGVSDT